jgi:methylase of polypeptide subunit release factors
VHVVGVDVNTAALAHARATCRRRQVSLLRGDLTSWARPGTFDVVIFNPPYVPTEAEELERAVRERDIAASWAGGERGREVIDRCMQGVRECMVVGGVFYLVLERANGLEEVRGLAGRCGFGDAAVVGKVAAGRELLFVVRFTAV